MSSDDRAGADPANLVLTGATGFVGSFLLAELLAKTRARIHCLVRCRDADEGRSRLAQTLASAGFPELARSPRIVPVQADLSKPKLGLADDDFDALAGSVDAVYHCGAFVNFIYPYSVLKHTNVLGTQEMLRLASKPSPKPFHYISTLRVFGSFGGPEPDVIDEETGLDHNWRLHSGYAQSKWVAERLVRLAGERRLPVATYRLGMISGHSRTGVSNLTDVLSRMIKGCIQLGTAPDLEMLVDVTPVDYVASAVVHLSQRKESLGKAFHLVTMHPVPWNDLTDWLRRFGYPLRRLSFETWRAELLEVARQSPDNAMSPLVLFFLDEMPSLAMRRFGCRNTLEGLVGSGITCPPASADLLATYLAYFAESGFLDRPSGTGDLSWRERQMPDAGVA